MNALRDVRLCTLAEIFRPANPTTSSQFHLQELLTYTRDIISKIKSRRKHPVSCQDFHRCPHHLQQNAGTVPQIMSRSLITESLNDYIWHNPSEANSSSASQKIIGILRNSKVNCRVLTIKPTTQLTN